MHLYVHTRHTTPLINLSCNCTNAVQLANKSMSSTEQKAKYKISTNLFHNKNHLFTKYIHSYLI